MFLKIRDWQWSNIEFITVRISIRFCSISLEALLILCIISLHEFIDVRYILSRNVLYKLNSKILVAKNSEPRWPIHLWGSRLWLDNYLSTAEFVSCNVSDDYPIAFTRFAWNTLGHLPNDIAIHFVENWKMQLKWTDPVKTTVHCTGLAIHCI